jgi:nicotinamide riboside transporter PnuC
MKYYGLDWLGTLAGLASIYYLSQQRRVGFVMRIIASLFWVAFGLVAGTVAGVIANIAVILLSFRGIREWKRAETRR